MDENTGQPPGSYLPPSNPPPPPVSALPGQIPPPPLRPPPPFATAAAAPRRGRGWMVLSIVLLVLFLFSMLLNVGHLFSGLSHGRRVTRTVGPKLDEVLTEDNNANAKIAVIDIRGIITSSRADGGFSMVDLVKAQLDRAEEDDRVKAVILKVDSPGGEVLASDEIYNVIQTFQTNSPKPVVGYMGNLAASGGYYISAPCRWIVPNELTITG